MHFKIIGDAGGTFQGTNNDLIGTSSGTQGIPETPEPLEENKKGQSKTKW